MIKQSEVSAESILHNGSWLVSARVFGDLVSKVYYGYTKREAMRLFVTEVNSVIVGVRYPHSAN